MQERYDSELRFEEDLVELLISKKGWVDGALMHPDERELIDNWADILFRKNNSRDRLNGVPLSEGEKAQLIEHLRAIDTPFAANRFINGELVRIKRDNPEDPEHLGREMYLEMFSRASIAGGRCTYQIARQPRFSAKSSMFPDRRGDFALLIDGLPVIHVELKKSGVSWTDALHQIEKYTNEGVFAGLFSLVQVFVCMTPEETRYLANPGRTGLENKARCFNRKFVFTWGDRDNQPVRRWDKVADELLSIPMAHKMVASYTVADAGDGCALKVLRSYQCIAVDAILKRLEAAKGIWGLKRPDGGYVWHTTGSGKTLTSFKAAQLAAQLKLVDKSVFIVDRVELGAQTFREYEGFADDDESVNEASNSKELLSLLLASKDRDKVLIVASINKLNNVAKTASEDQLRRIAALRVAITADECHRSTFGEMMGNIKRAFPNAMLIGFTGTPITKDNAKNTSTTYDVFGPQIARYTLRDGITDENVLRFEVNQVETFPAEDLRKQVALKKANAKDEEEVKADPEKARIYREWIDKGKHPMAGWWEQGGRYHKGIEDFVPNAQYDCDGHRKTVVRDIKRRWDAVTCGGRLHAVLATSSISEAMEYYRLIKKEMPEIAAACLFDPTLDNKEGDVVKEDMLVEILEDYSKRYGKTYVLKTHDEFKADASARMAHKGPYARAELAPDQKLDLLIVVNQMLTGYDSKWLGALFLDKRLEYENIIQAFSRTNRNLDAGKTCGVIRYYRRVHTMARDIKAAVELYSGGRALDLFVVSICENVEMMNASLAEITAIFEAEGIEDFSRLPGSDASKKMFGKQFNIMSRALRAAMVQGFSFDEAHYECEGFPTGKRMSADCELDEETYRVLLVRYGELDKGKGGDGGKSAGFDVDPELAVLGSESIDKDYVNQFFRSFLISVNDGKPEEEITAALEALHSTYPHLSAADQADAERAVSGIRRGTLEVHMDWTCMDYVSHVREMDFQKQAAALADGFGVYAGDLAALVRARPDADDINEYGRFDELVAKVDAQRARRTLETLSGRAVKAKDVMPAVDAVLRRFVLENGCDVAQAVREEVEG